MNDELTEMILASYDAGELCAIFELDAEHIINALVRLYPELMAENMYKFRPEFFHE